MRYFLFSTIFHLLLVLGGYSLLKEEISFSSVGNSKVTFSEFNGSSAQTIKVNPSKKSEGDKSKKIDKKKKKSKEKKSPIKKVKKFVEKKQTVKDVKKKEEIPDNNNQKEKIFKETTITENKSNDKLESKKNTLKEKKIQETSDNGTSEKVSENEDSNAYSEEMAGFVQLKDGSLVAKNQGVKGLKYGFLNNPEPNYPQMAKKLGIRDIIKIRARILIGYDGRVEEVKYYDNYDKYGFREEVKKALDQWKTTPIESNGVKVKLYFYKEFRFELEN